MQQRPDLRSRSEHFDFGENWASYSGLIDDRRIEQAVANVGSLVGDLAGKSFLDIGSGSGLFSLAALRLGASKVLAVDIDEASVATTRKVLEANAPGANYAVENVSVFDLSAARHDVVYSWGVLHHTGDMWQAIEKAASLAEDTFAFALYEKTPLCGAWRVEKRFYSKAPPMVQMPVRGAYLAAYGLGLLASGRNPFRRIRENRERGMDTRRDVHDWLGGYPYESTTLAEVDPFMHRLGFTLMQHNPAPVHLSGLFGTGCTEYVYRRI